MNKINVLSFVAIVAFAFGWIAVGFGLGLVLGLIVFTFIMEEVEKEMEKEDVFISDDEVDETRYDSGYSILKSAGVKF